MATASFRLFALLGLYTETPLHCGAESASGYIDLPIQRERHTLYPLIPGSTLKGVLHDECDAAVDDKGQALLAAPELEEIFGAFLEATRETRPGQVSFGDGVLVAFPVRSSGAPFHWVTCPYLLARALRLLGQSWEHQGPARGQAWAKAGLGNSCSRIWW